MRRSGLAQPAPRACRRKGSAKSNGGRSTTARGFASTVRKRRRLKPTSSGIRSSSAVPAAARGHATASRRSSRRTTSLGSVGALPAPKTQGRRSRSVCVAFRDCTRRNSARSSGGPSTTIPGSASNVSKRRRKKNLSSGNQNSSCVSAVARSRGPVSCSGSKRTTLRGSVVALNARKPQTPGRLRPGRLKRSSAVPSATSGRLRKTSESSRRCWSASVLLRQGRTGSGSPPGWRGSTPFPAAPASAWLTQSRGASKLRKTAARCGACGVARCHPACTPVTSTLGPKSGRSWSWRVTRRSSRPPRSSSSGLRQGGALWPCPW
mmetsp:Transcript_18666/g.59292  ORF Transcript_18666/g.59292 Transcript_18666/m.59292 type:complete len:321 (-) Transcript_18666:1283-2245(-)